MLVNRKTKAFPHLGNSFLALVFLSLAFSSSLVLWADSAVERSLETRSRATRERSRRQRYL